MRTRFKLAPLSLGALVIAAVLLGAGGPGRAAQAGGYNRVVDPGMVNCTTSSGATVYTTINAALADSMAGEAIFVCPGLYAEPALTISDANLTLQGAGPGMVTVRSSVSAGFVF